MWRGWDLIWKMIFPVILLGLVFWYGTVKAAQFPPLPLLNETPEKSRGRIVTLAYMKVREVLDPHRFESKVWGRRTIFLYQNHNLQKGDFISLRAVYLHPESLQVTYIKRHPLRPVKRMIGMAWGLGFLLFLCYLGIKGGFSVGGCAYKSLLKIKKKIP